MTTEPRAMTSCLLIRGGAAAGGSAGPAGPAGPVEVLLGVKKTGFGVGKVVGPGGKVDPGETPEEAAVRELKEETGIRAEVADLHAAAVLTFRFPARPAWDLRMFVYTAERFAGEPVESDEIACEWLPVTALPYDRMWDDARLWLPRVLAGEPVEAEITYDAAGERVAGVRFRRAGPDPADRGPEAVG